MFDVTYYLCNNDYIFVEEINCIFHPRSTASLVIPENSTILIFLCMIIYAATLNYMSLL